MKKITITFLSMLIIFASCDIGDKLNKKADESNDDFEQQSVQIASDVKVKKDYYYEYELEFPTLTAKSDNSDKEIVDLFNTEIAKFINSYLKEFDKTSLLEKKEIVDIIIEEDSIEAKDNHMVYSLGITYVKNEYSSSEKEGAGILSVKFTIDNFNLGAHANTYFKTFNFDLATGKFLSIKDILKLNNEKEIYALDGLIAKHFDDPLKCFDISPKSTLKDVQFSLTEENAVFSFQPYILGAYSCGSSTILIPIGQLKEAKLWQNK